MLINILKYYRWPGTAIEVCYKLSAAKSFSRSDFRMISGLLIRWHVLFRKFCQFTLDKCRKDTWKDCAESQERKKRQSICKLSKSNCELPQSKEGAKDDFSCYLFMRRCDFPGKYSKFFKWKKALISCCEREWLFCSCEICDGSIRVYK